MKGVDEPEIMRLPVMDEQTAWEWCNENAYESLIERNVEDLMDVLPEGLQAEILEWEKENLYAVLYLSNKVKVEGAKARNYNKRPARPTGKARW